MLECGLARVHCVEVSKASQSWLRPGVSRQIVRLCKTPGDAWPGMYWMRPGGGGEWYCRGNGTCWCLTLIRCAADLPSLWLEVESPRSVEKLYAAQSVRLVEHFRGTHHCSRVPNARRGRHLCGVALFLCLTISVRCRFPGWQERDQLGRCRSNDRWNRWNRCRTDPSGNS